MSPSPASDVSMSTGPEVAQHHAQIEHVFRRQRTTKRSSHACLNCRRRKVRCNVIETFPCANCKHYDLKCGIPPKSIFRVAKGHREVNVSETKGFSKTTEYELSSPPLPTQRVEQDLQQPKHSDARPFIALDLGQPFDSLLGHISTLSKEMQCLREQGAFAATPVVLILQAMTIHQLQMNSNDPSVQQEALRMFVHGKDCLEAMRDRFLAQGFTTGYLDEMLERSESFIAERKSSMPHNVKTFDSSLHLKRNIQVSQIPTPTESTDNYTLGSLHAEERLANNEDLRSPMGDLQNTPIYTGELDHDDVKKTGPDTLQSNQGRKSSRYHDSWQAMEFACQIEKDFGALLDTMLGAEQTG